MIYDELRRPVWNGGQIMAFSALDGVTDYHGALTARTAFDAPGIDITLPARGRIRFPGVTRADNLVAGDWFRFGGEHPTVGVFLDTHHLLLEGPCVVSHAEPGIACATDGDRTLIGSSARFDPGKIATDVMGAVRDRCRWLESLRFPAVRSRAARRTLIKALSTMKTQVYSPEGRIRHRWTTPDRWPHRQMWLWDSAFHAIGWRHIVPELAQDAIFAVFDMQAPTGFIPHMMNPAETSPITQPPVLAMAAKLVHDIAGEKTWIRALYPRLCAYITWDLNNRDTDGGGLLEWQIDGNPHCRSGESGMDNSPRFDAATRMDAVDFNSFLSLECEIVAGLADDLGLAAAADMNWLIARGFERYGFDDVAAQFRSRTLDAIEDAFEKDGALFEFYDDRGEVPPFRRLRKGKCAPDESPFHQVVHDYGWTASLYVDLSYAGENTATARASKADAGDA